MNDRPLHIVDVFAERPYAGNQLAVVSDARGLAPEAMQAIAREMNFSETSFVLDREPGPQGFAVRIFTPAHEVPFAGHPTLGTAWVIRETLGVAAHGGVTLALAAGSIPVTFERDGQGLELLWMRQRSPEFGPTVDARELAPVLGIAAADFDPGFPVRRVSTGLPFWIAPLASLDAVRRCRVDLPAYEAFVGPRDTQSIFVFARQALRPENQLHARMFSPYYGVTEDPATGSANGCLAAYLVEHGVLGGRSVDVRVEQGHEMGRPSLLYLRAGRDAGSIEVRVGGRVIPVARGTLV